MTEELYTTQDLLRDVAASERETVRAHKEIKGMPKARPCRCEIPMFFTDVDGSISCVKCGRGK